MRDDLEKVLATNEISARDKSDLIVSVPEEEYIHARSFLKELLPSTVEADSKPDEIHERSIEIQLRVKDFGALEDFWKRSVMVQD